MFPYQWLDSKEKLSHKGSVSYGDLCRSLKTDKYIQLLKELKANDFTDD